MRWCWCQSGNYSEICLGAASGDMENRKQKTCGTTGWKRGTAKPAVDEAYPAVQNRGHTKGREIERDHLCLVRSLFQKRVALRTRPQSVCE